MDSMTSVCVSRCMSDMPEGVGAAEIVCFFNCIIFIESFPFCYSGKLCQWTARKLDDGMNASSGLKSAAVSQRLCV